MKKLFLPLFLLFFLVSSCFKDEDCVNPVDCLPPTTQTGEGTIGCLINGKPFTPGGHQLAGPTQDVYYQQLDGGYYFGLSANDRREGSSKSVRIFLRDQEITEGETYVLNTSTQDSHYGEYTAGAARYRTHETYKGEIKFTNFDDESGIVSGTFWFDAVNEDGEIVELREGRFDMKL